MKTILFLILFSILTVLPAQAAEEKAFTLSWDEVTTNEDGTPLTDLAGYKVYTLIGEMYLQLGDDIPEGTETTAGMIAPGEHCFVVTAYDTSGNESEHSDQACIDVLGPSKVIKLIITVTKTTQ